jgi:hypothetical protein
VARSRAGRHVGPRPNTRPSLYSINLNFPWGTSVSPPDASYIRVQTAIAFQGTWEMVRATPLRAFLGLSLCDAPLLVPEGDAQRVGPLRPPSFQAWALPRADPILGPVELWDSQPETFPPSSPAAVEPLPHALLRSGEARHGLEGFCLRQDRRPACGRFRPPARAGAVERLVAPVAVQEAHSAAGVMVGRGRPLPLHGQEGQKRLECCPGQLLRVHRPCLRSPHRNPGRWTGSCADREGMDEIQGWSERPSVRSPVASRR